MLKVGDNVHCRLYNVPDKSYYGKSWVGEIKEIDAKMAGPLYKGHRQQRRFTVTRPGHANIKLTRREILRKV